MKNRLKRLALLLALFGAGSGMQAHAAEQPNIIFILSDDISPKDYALYGGKTASPVIKKMAQDGLYFRTAWATPRCIPTRAMLLTGKYAWKASDVDELYDLEADPFEMNNVASQDEDSELCLEYREKLYEVF
jgi:hypothetical protein